MNKSEFVNAVAEKAGISKKDAAVAVDAMLESIRDALKAGEKVQLVGFGSFEVKNRPARKGHDPRTKKEIDIPASKLPTFKAGKALKDAM